MTDGEKKVVAVFLIVIGIVLFVLLTPAGRSMWNKDMYAVEKADDATNYRKMKTVEDSCRLMIASYTSDKLIWEQYKDSEDKEQRGWADQAKIRANKTAASYNSYVLKNSYIWKDNVPEDIKQELEYLK